jgi:hypothetical protein
MGFNCSGGVELFFHSAAATSAIAAAAPATARPAAVAAAPELLLREYVPW